MIRTTTILVSAVIASSSSASEARAARLAALERAAATAAASTAQPAAAVHAPPVLRESQQQRNERHQRELAARDAAEEAAAANAEEEARAAASAAAEAARRRAASARALIAMLENPRLAESGEKSRLEDELMQLGDSVGDAWIEAAAEARRLAMEERATRAAILAAEAHAAEMDALEAASVALAIELQLPEEAELRDGFNEAALQSRQDAQARETERRNAPVVAKLMAEASDRAASSESRIAQRAALLAQRSAARKAGDLAGEAAALRGLVKLSEADASALMQLGEFLESHGDLGEAAVMLARAIDSGNTTNSEGLYFAPAALGRVLFKLGRLDEAREVFPTALDEFSALPRLKTLVGPQAAAFLDEIFQDDENDADDADDDDAEDD